MSSPMIEFKLADQDNPGGVSPIIELKYQLLNNPGRVSSIMGTIDGTPPGFRYFVLPVAIICGTPPGFIIFV
jgi:hypothetical protein